MTIDAPATSTPSLDQPADLVIPVDGGSELQPAVLASLPIGQGPGQLVLQNGEFGTPVAVLPDHIVVVEDVPFDGLTGRVLLLDRTGTWQRDIQVPELLGQRISWLAGAPNGTVFVVSSGADEVTSTLRAFALINDEFVLVDSAEPQGLTSPFLTVGPAGSLDGTTTVMEIDTGASLSIVAATLDIADSSDAVARIVINDSAETADPWRLDVGFDDSTSADRVTAWSGRSGSAIWYAGNTSAAPTVGGPFLALLNDDRTATWARLGPWTLAAADDSSVIVTTATLDGLVIATATGAATVPTSENRLESWPAPPNDVGGIADVPSLLPTIATVGTGKPVRAAYDTGGAPPTIFTQIFADAERDILLTLQTHPGGRDSTPADMREPITWFSGDRVVAQMLVSPGHTDLIAQALSASFDRVDVNGAEAWLNPNSGRRSIVWSPDGTTIVVLGVADDTIDPLLIARSVIAMGAAEYELATTTLIPPGVGDGCDGSLFC